MPYYMILWTNKQLLKKCGCIKSPICPKRYMMKKQLKKAGRPDAIHIFGAREHNLKNIDVSIPKNSLTVITGPSGSGKSSLALDILYTEGKRRYMESLSAYARQFLGVAKKPDVERIEGLCPSIAIEQKTVSANPRSTVGTVTEIYDYLRVLFARVGEVHCPECFSPISAQSPESITSMIMEEFRGNTITVTAPIAQQKKGEFKIELQELFKKGYYRFLINGNRYRFRSESEIMALSLKKTYKHDIDLLIDHIEVEPSALSRLQESIERSFSIAGGVVKLVVGDQEYTYSCDRVCLRCAQSVPELEPRSFSFNSPIGACKTCSGLGTTTEWPWQEGDPDAWKAKYPDFFGPKYGTISTCESCLGTRLNKIALAVTIGDKNIFEVCQLSIQDVIIFFDTVKLTAAQKEIGASLFKEIKNRVKFLLDVGLSYLTLNRTACTLSGGEGQRIRLATQIGSSLSGVCYVLDEPSIGLHQRDNDRLIATLKALRDQGNTVVVVEHDTDTMWAADHIIDMGPGAGMHGGAVTATGDPQMIAANTQSLSGAYLCGSRAIEAPSQVRTPDGYLILKNAKKNNLKAVTARIPLGVLCGISGVSGSGKSTLIMQELVPRLTQALENKKRSKKVIIESLEGAERISNMVVIDQSPIGRTPRSNPATYLGIFDEIRRLYASLPASNERGYTVGRFSFNVPDGRCFECKGDGAIKVTMHFLPEVTMVCKACNGLRYNRETLQITYKGKTIADVLAMTAYEAREFFAHHRNIYKRLSLLCDVGLSYLHLGQPSSTLSGGEAQRIKLVSELAKRGQNTLYVLDEPTTGLHSDDIRQLLIVLNKLVNKGNSMVIIEHNLDVLRSVDYLIDLGPEGGEGGGTILVQGAPQEIARYKESHTGRYLKKVL